MNKINFTNQLYCIGDSYVITIPSLIVKTLKLEKGNILELDLLSVSKTKVIKK